MLSIYHWAYFRSCRDLGVASANKVGRPILGHGVSLFVAFEGSGVSAPGTCIYPCLRARKQATSKSVVLPSTELSRQPVKSSRFDCPNIPDLLCPEGPVSENMSVALSAEIIPPMLCAFSVLFAGD